VKVSSVEPRSISAKFCTHKNFPVEYYLYPKQPMATLITSQMIDHCGVSKYLTAD